MVGGVGSFSGLAVESPLPVGGWGPQTGGGGGVLSVDDVPC